jgi:DNA-binding SARP family transcriptional activator
VEIRALGPLQVLLGGRPVDLKGLRQRAVLAVLVIEANRVVSADRLADLVWDGAPPERAQASLQAYVSKLRRVLEPDNDGRERPWQHLVTRAPGYSFLIDPIATDTGRFEHGCADAITALRAGDATTAATLLDDALALWRGEPYADFTFSGFARNEISRLHELRWRAIEARGDAWLALARHDDLIAALEPLVRDAPLRERLRAQQALALYRRGRQADALAALAAAREVLLDELGLDPGPELQRLEQDILRQDPELDAVRPAPAPLAEPPAADPPTDVSAGVAAGGAPGVASGPEDDAGSATGPARPPMVGRAGDLARASHLVDAARAGRGELLLVLGEAGIGKSRLAEETAAHAEAAGVQVLWGRCPDLEGAPPFWPWTQVLRSYLAAHPETPVVPRLEAFWPDAGERGGRLVPAEHPPSNDDESGGLFQLIDAAAAFLAEIAAQHPLLIVLEDLHWADSASLQLVRFLTVGAPPGAMSVLATSREVDEGAPLDALKAEMVRAPRADTCVLEHLDRDAVAELVQRMTGATVTPGAVTRVLRRSGGNPFFVGELVRLGDDGGDAVPVGVRDVIRRRIGQLDDPVRELLLAAACCPDGFGLDAITAVLERPLDDVADDVDAALAARLLQEVPDRAGRFRFEHLLVRDAIVDQLSTLRRGRLHLRWARALESTIVGTPTDDVVAQLAHHFSQAAALGTTPEAVRWSIEAGRRALDRWAAEDAEQIFQRALDLAQHHGGVEEHALIDLHIGLGRARRFRGDGSGHEVLDEAMTAARRIGDAERLVTAVLARGEGTWSHGNTFGVVDDELRNALEWAVAALDDERAKARTAGRARLAFEYIFSSDPARAVATSARAVDDARALGDQATLVQALMAHWVATWGPTTAPARTALLDELEAIVHRQRFDAARLLQLRWTEALEQGDMAGCAEVQERTEAYLARGHNPSVAMQVAWRRSLRSALDGEFEDAEKLIVENHETMAGLDPHEALDATGGQLALLYWLSGRLAALVPLLQGAMDEQPYLASAFGPILALAMVHAGQDDDARALVEQLGVTGWATAPEPLVRSGTVGALAEVAVHLEDHALARAVLSLLGDDERSGAIIDQMGVFYNGARGRYRGELQLLLGDETAAIASMRRGLAIDERMAAVVFVLRDRLCLADALIRRGAPGDRDEALLLLSLAHGDAERLALEADLARIDALRASAAAIG